MPAEPTHREHLQSLAWLVGDSTSDLQSVTA